MSSTVQRSILVLNSGSSSLKFQLIEMPEERSVCHGLAERLGSEKALLKLYSDQGKREEKLGRASHKRALERIAELRLEDMFAT